jgi:hypothetical protein
VVEKMVWKMMKHHPSYNDLKVVRTPWGFRLRIKPGLWMRIDGASFEKFKHEAGLIERPTSKEKQQ